MPWATRQQRVGKKKREQRENLKVDRKMQKRAGGAEGGEKPLLTPGLCDNLICV